MSSYPRRHLKLLRTASTWVTFSSPLEWAMVIFLLMLAVLGTLTAPRMWNGGQLMEQDEPSPAWPWGGALWRGYVRIRPLLPVELWVTLLTLLVARFTPRHTLTPWWVAAPTAVWMLLSFIVLPAIVLFARPQFLIPPAVRGRPGALAEWRHHRGRGRLRR